MIERLLVAVIVLSMLALLIRSLYRSWSGKDKGCAGCPGCSTQNDDSTSTRATNDKRRNDG